MSLPVDRDQARGIAGWLRETWGAAITSAVAGTAFTPEIVCAIACKEEGDFLARFYHRESAATVLACCIGDASGDFPGTRRSAFPKNTAAFRARFGDALTDQLIAEANTYRALVGYHPRQWVYKGYGIFQYDLQNILGDEDFFRNKRWHDFGACLDRLMKELHSKYHATGDLWLAIKAYNGSGAAADQYARDVRKLVEYIG